MSTTVYACGYFSPSQLSGLQSLLDDVTADQDLSFREREQLARTIISLAQIGVTSKDELRRMLRKATSDLLLEWGQSRRSELRHASLRGERAHDERSNDTMLAAGHRRSGAICEGRETAWDEGLQANQSVNARRFGAAAGGLALGDQTSSDWLTK